MTAAVVGTAAHMGAKSAQNSANAQQQQTQTAAPVAPEPAPAAPGIDMEQLKQLGDLHTAGVLSDEEFAAAKAKLLGI